MRPATQGHIRKRIHTTKSGKKTVTWYVVIELPRGADGRRRQKWHGGFRTRREAEAARAKIIHEVNTGAYVEPSVITLTEWVRNQWLPTIRSRVKPSTFDSYQRNIDLPPVSVGNRGKVSPNVRPSGVCSGDDADRFRERVVVQLQRREPSPPKPASDPRIVANHTPRSSRPAAHAQYSPAVDT